MAPAKKRARTAQPDDKTPPPALLADPHVSWLLSSEEPYIQLIAGDVALTAKKEVLTRNSEYFETCLKQPYKESDGVVRFDDINPKHLAYYIGVAYYFSTIVPRTIPVPVPNPEAQAFGPSLGDWVEVYKLCDRFISHRMGEYVMGCIKTTIANGHRALFRSVLDREQQKRLMRDFADAYEALEQAHTVQKGLALTIIDYFVQGIDYDSWDMCMDEVIDRSRFVAQVSKGFARKLAEAMATRSKLKRKELEGP